LGSGQVSASIRCAPPPPKSRSGSTSSGTYWAQIGKICQDRALFLTVLGNTYFWFLGSLLFSTIVVYGPDVLHVGQTKTGYLNAALAVGIGLGSMAAGWISDKKIEYGLIPLGSVGMTDTGFALGIVPHGMTGSAALLGLLGFWAGFFGFPVNALIQYKLRSRTRAASLRRQIFSRLLASRFRPAFTSSSLPTSI
jgi:acyl-[acyl-carrier-protein]-phospholipid O-acyltransferase/long-chain-fatty-acid--[acyl-carrier-protein] ligase